MMAKATKRWAVRDAGWGQMYRVYIGSKPRKNKIGEWPSSRRRVATRWPLWMRGELFEAIFPIRLKPGGGPVEIRFADEA